MKNFRKNKKALSPVVASIILIAVTVAVSIAVAAWMGALVIGQMATEEVKVTNVEFVSATEAKVTAKNIGATEVVISDAYIGTSLATSDLLANGQPIAPNSVLTVNITGSFTPGQSYQFKLVSAKGNPFVLTATAPL